MSKQNFIDKVYICVRSGNGGRGAVHFRHEKYVPHGGPDGGDGGNGGNVIIKGNKTLSTLYHLKNKHKLIADNGADGGENNRKGKDANDLFIEVPLGTSVIDTNTGNIITDITENDAQTIILYGGKGGKGNTFFKSPTNQTPYFAQQGCPGNEISITLSLKSLADVGLVGLPNVGKSTLLSVISSAKPNIADYPFTTLTPQLGVVYRNKPKGSFIVADIPGIIEGAAQGKGLGLQFLQHIERTSCIVYVIDATSEYCVSDYKLLQQELKNYNSILLDKLSIICVSKCDLVSPTTIESIENDFKCINIKDIICISSTNGSNIETLLSKIHSIVLISHSK